MSAMTDTIKNVSVQEAELPDGPVGTAVTSTANVAVAEPVSLAEQAEAQTPIEPDAPRDEVERVEPSATGPVTLSSGTQVEVVPLKLRETMKLLKIVTRGAGAVLEQLMGELDLNDPVAFAQTLGALVILSIPEAENEVIDFVRSMVIPVGFSDLSAKERAESFRALAEELDNPELEDVISIVERVIRRESEDIRNLGKRISTAFNLASKVNALAEAK